MHCRKGAQAVSAAGCRQGSMAEELQGFALWENPGICALFEYMHDGVQVTADPTEAHDSQPQARTIIPALPGTQSFLPAGLLAVAVVEPCQCFALLEQSGSCLRLIPLANQSEAELSFFRQLWTSLGKHDWVSLAASCVSAATALAKAWLALILAQPLLAPMLWRIRLHQPPTSAGTMRSKGWGLRPKLPL